MKATSTNKLGGLWFSAVPMLEGERLLKAELASQRYSPTRGALGRLYLSNKRLIWSPDRRLSWIFRKKPQIISLAEIEGCTLGEPDFFSGYPTDVHTVKAMYRFYVYSSCIGWIRATRDEATKWVAAIERAVSAVKQADADRV